MTKQSEAASSTQPETKMSDAELLEKQREIIVNLRLEKHELREQAIAALRKATGCAFVVCEDLLADAYQVAASRTVERPTEFVTSSTVAGWGGGEREGAEREAFDQFWESRPRLLSPKELARAAYRAGAAQQLDNIRNDPATQVFGMSINEVQRAIYLMRAGAAQREK